MNKETAIKFFAQKIVENYHPDFSEDYRVIPFINEDDFGKGGLTGADIRKIVAGDGKILSFIKIYPLENEKLAHTHLLVPACDTLRALPLRELKLILPIKEEAFLIDNQPHEIIATLPAPGRCVVDYLKDLSKNEVPLEDALYIVKKTALSLGELNSLSIKQTTHLAPVIEELEDLCINVFRLYLEEQPRLFPFSLQEFEEYFAKIFLHAHTIPFKVGYVHGDGNLTNVFYDFKTDLIYLIDSLSIFHSIQSNGQPAGNIAHEYCYMRRSFEIFALYYGLDSKIRQQIDKAFVESYPIELSPIQLKYYDLLTWMGWFLIAYKTSLAKPLLAADMLKLQHVLGNKIHQELHP